MTQIVGFARGALHDIDLFRLLLDRPQREQVGGAGARSYEVNGHQFSSIASPRGFTAAHCTTARAGAQPVNEPI